MKYQAKRDKSGLGSTHLDCGGRLVITTFTDGFMETRMLMCIRCKAEAMATSWEIFQ